MKILFSSTSVVSKLLAITNRCKNQRYLSLGNVMMEKPPRKSNRMFSWSIHNYTKDVNDIEFTETNKPTIESPSQLLIKISASSVNPIDVAMMNGYGASLLNSWRCRKSDIEFPLTFGRDFVGVVINKGMQIKNEEFCIGDKVWGVLPVHHQGCHCEYIAIDKRFISLKPHNLKDVDASALLYAGLTSWSGLNITGRLGQKSNSERYKVAVLGASGGVGSIAVQILLAENVEVIATCGEDAISFVRNLGVEKVIDYKSKECDAVLIREAPYDIILDCAGKGTDYANSLDWTFGNYVTFSSPLLKNIDNYGLLRGSLFNIRDLVLSNIPRGIDSHVKWGFFIPSQTGIQYLKKLVENNKLRPVIDSVFNQKDLPQAYKKVLDGHLRGKVIIDFTM